MKTKQSIKKIENLAVRSAASINDLPDAAFAIILPGGKKDEDGKTVPRSLRKLPHHNGSVQRGTENTTVDIPHLRNALARVAQESTDLSPEQRAKARGHLEAHAKALGIGAAAEENVNLKQEIRRMKYKLLGLLQDVISKDSNFTNNTKAKQLLDMHMGGGHVHDDEMHGVHAHEEGDMMVGHEHTPDNSMGMHRHTADETPSGGHNHDEDESGTHSHETEEQQKPMMPKEPMMPEKPMPEKMPDDEDKHTDEDIFKRKKSSKMAANIPVAIKVCNEFSSEDGDLVIEGIAISEGVHKGLFYPGDVLNQTHTGLIGKPLRLAHEKGLRDVVGKITQTKFMSDGKKVWFQAKVFDELAKKLITENLINEVSVGVLVDRIQTQQGLTIANPEWKELSLVEDGADPNAKILKAKLN